LLHPDLVIRNSPLSGRGLFAIRKILKGTIIWRWDKDNERIYTKSQLAKFSKRYQDIVRKYGNEYNNQRINYSIDASKYWNHSCDPNTAPLTSEILYMDIAIKDIEIGEEMTFDYSLVMSGKWPQSFRCNCDTRNCRGIIPKFTLTPKMLNNLSILAREAARDSAKVYQPLLKTSYQIYSLPVTQVSDRTLKNIFVNAQERVTKFE
jgi:hypothetical protein